MARVSKPKEGRGRSRFLSPEERERLLGACRASGSRALYTIVVLALSTGMRRGEIMGLRWGAVDLARGRATLFETKNGDQRTVPLVGHAHECLGEWAKVKRIDTDLVFPGSKSGVAAAPLPFEKHWRRAIRDAALDNFRFHDLRHCTASYLAMCGATLSEIAEVLGHKTLQMVKRYSHLSEAHTRGVIAALDRSLFSAPNELKESRGLRLHEEPVPHRVGVGISSEKP